MTEVKRDKPVREFWIEFGGDPSDDKECYKRYCSTAKFEPSSFSDEVIHCIEYQAHAELQKRYDEILGIAKNFASMINHFTDCNAESGEGLDDDCDCGAQKELDKFRKFLS